MVGSACVAPVPAGPAESGAGGAPSSAASGSPSSIFGPPQPIDVAVVLDTDSTVEAVIPVEGGTITATGVDGSVYSLHIPADALLTETTIGLTPITSIAGMPFGGDQTHAVQLSPDGLSLFNHAVLTITPAAEIPVDQQILFGYLHQGEDLIFAPPVVDATEIKINVLHFSGSGVTNATQAAIDPLREQLGGDAERRLSSAVAERLGRERQRQLGLGEHPDIDDPELAGFFEESWRQFEEQVIKPRIAAASKSCEAGKLAIQTILGYERQRQLLGASDGHGAFDKYSALYNLVAHVCVVEEFEACVEAHRIYLMLPLYHGLLRQHSLISIYSPATLEEARDLTIKCLTFRLEMESTGRINFQGLASAESDVTMDLMLRYDPDLGLISGVGEYVNTDYEVHPPPTCSAQATPGGGTFVAIGLLYELDYGQPDRSGSYPDARVSDLTLAYSPDNSSEKATLTCPNTPDPPSIIPFDIPTWSTAFFDAHLNELDDSGLKAVDWDVLGGELFAEKEWDLIGVADPLGSEEGSFTLFHVPGG